MSQEKLPHRHALLVLAALALVSAMGAYAYTALIASTSVNVSPNAYISSVSVSGGSCAISSSLTSATCVVAGYEGDVLTEIIVVAVHTSTISHVTMSMSSTDEEVASVSSVLQRFSISPSSPATLSFTITLLSTGSATVSVSVAPS